MDQLFHYIKLIIQDSFRFLKQRNTLVILAVVFANTVNMLMNHANGLAPPIAVVLLLVYLVGTDSTRQQKAVLVFVYLAFSILTIGGESTMIAMSKGSALQYGTPSAGGNVPLWLFAAYLNMVLMIQLLTDYGNMMYVNILDGGINTE